MSELEVPMTGLDISEESNEGIEYGCTIVESCGLVWDDYEDWYYHVRTAHPKELNLWFCNEGWKRSKDENPCDLAFYTREEFEKHYESAHPVALEEGAKHDSDDRLLGPKLGNSYWCGFCVQVHGPDAVDSTGDDIEDWWLEYSQHMKNHYEGVNPEDDKRYTNLLGMLGEWYWFKGPGGSAK